MQLDQRTEKNISTLVTKAQAVARTFIISASEAMRAKGVEVKIISGTRTYAEQNALYA